MSRLAARLRALVVNQLELHERRALLDRPWEEEFLHWAGDSVEAGSARMLHGHLVPPAGRRRHSVTSSGWCPGVRAHRARRTHAVGEPGG